MGDVLRRAIGVPWPFIANLQFQAGFDVSFRRLKTILKLKRRVDSAETTNGLGSRAVFS
jgi:hypothetical protein